MKKIILYIVILLFLGVICGCHKTSTPPVDSANIKEWLRQNPDS